MDGDDQTEIVVVSVGPTVKIFSSNGTIERSIPIEDQRIDYGSAPALADLNGDSVPEIIIQTEYGLNRFYGTGSICPGWPQIWRRYYNGKVEYEQWNSSPVVGDVGGDTHPEIVVVLKDSAKTPYTERCGEVRVYNSYGQLLPGFPKVVARQGDGAVPAIADIDLDGRNEIIVTGDFWNGIADYYEIEMALSCEVT